MKQIKDILFVGTITVSEERVSLFFRLSARK